jgi:hypothetical protein
MAAELLHARLRSESLEFTRDCLIESQEQFNIRETLSSLRRKEDQKQLHN